MTYNDCWTYPKDKIDEMTKNAIISKNGTVSAATGVTLTEKRIAQRGSVVEVNFIGTLSSAIGSSEKTLCTIAGVQMPSDKTRFICGTGTHGYDAVHPAYAILDPANGEVHALASTTTDTVIDIHFVYTVN